MTTPIAQKLLDWYTQHKRDFPWRGHPDPYAVWVSEIMSQQTRLETILPYFNSWMARFPTIASLADADQHEVLNLWEGLGYYSRARNMHKAAQILLKEHDGQLPSQAAALRRLPGIGRYTAGAVSSLAFGRDEPVVDGNVKRVLARLFGVDIPVNTSAGEKAIWGLAAEHLPAGRAGDYNQALMDLGAAVCLPRGPACSACPLEADCFAFAEHKQTELPRKRPKSIVPHHIVAAAVLNREDRVLIAQRPEDGLLGGMWEFPGGKQEPGEELPACLTREIKEELGVKIKVGGKIGVYQHAYTHFKITLHAFTCTLSNRQQPRPIEARQLRWVTLDQLEDFPMGKLDRQISRQLIHLDEGSR